MLPPIETCPVLVLRWTSKALTFDSEKKLIRDVSKVLERNGLIILPNKARDILLLTTTQSRLEEQAEESRLVKQRWISNDEQIMDYFRVSQRQQFCLRNTSSSSSSSSSFGRRKRPSDDGKDPHGMFGAHERSHLVQDLFENISIQKKMDGDLQKLFYGDSSNLNPQSTSSSSSLRYLLLRHGFIDTLTPLHNDELKMSVLNETCYPLSRRRPPSCLINEYYGPSIAFYFAFAGFLLEWLLPLGILGFTIFLFRVYRNDTLDEDEYTPFYGLFCFLWAVMFTISWERREKELAYGFGTLPLLDRRLSHITSFGIESEGTGHKRPEFVGIIRTSPVTGRSELFYPSSRRRIHYLFSALVTLAMLVVAFWLMILSLNLQGYIAQKGEVYHPFHYPQLSVLATEGGILDSTSSWRSLIPVVIHAAGIFVLNTIYRMIATKLTDMENHMTQDAYDNSLVLKRFLFEAFDCYIVLFYLAFYERDVLRLRSELIAVFNIDSFRRLLMEVVVPFALHLRDSYDNDHPQDLDLDEYEPYDDYMEILIQLGYVTLFASAYPLASLVMCGAIWIEIRSDCYKLTHLCQKPIAERVYDIGMWKQLLKGLVWLSCLTNCLLFGFTSEQMVHYLPHLYVQDDNGDAHIVHDKGWIAVFVMFGVERVLILIGILLRKMVPSMSEELSIDIQRRRYLIACEEEAPKKVL